MKKHLALFIAFTILTTSLSCVPISAHAETNDTAHEKILCETTEYFEDGSSATIIVTEESSASARSASYTKSGLKHYTFYDQNKKELWRFTVHGTFTVNPGVSATCTESSYSITIYDDTWKNDLASVYHSGNQAIGHAIFIKKLLFFTVDTQDCNVILTCDANGNLF